MCVLVGVRERENIDIRERVSTRDVSSSTEDFPHWLQPPSPFNRPAVKRVKGQFVHCQLKEADRKKGVMV